MTLSPELIEQLADREHDSWARWMEYLLACCVLLRDKHPGAADPDDVVIPGEKVRRWRRQVETSYGDLSEREKQSDRDEVQRIVPLIEAEYGCRSSRDRE